MCACVCVQWTAKWLNKILMMTKYFRRRSSNVKLIWFTIAIIYFIHLLLKFTHFLSSLSLYLCHTDLGKLGIVEEEGCGGRRETSTYFFGQEWIFLHKWIFLEIPYCMETQKFVITFYYN